MPAHRLWMKSGASGRAIDLDHSPVDDHEDQNTERLDGKLNDHALQEQPEQRPQLHSLQRFLHGPRPDVDDLRPDAFRFERPGNLGQGDKSVPLPVGAAVYKQYFHSGNVCVRANIGFFGITYTAACSLPDGTPRPESARHIAPCASGGGGHPPAAFRSRDAPGKTGRHPVPPCPLP